MKNINISVDSKNSKVYLEDDIIGVDGENLQGKIIFSFINDFIDGIAWLEVMKDNQKSYLPMKKIDNTYQVDILSSLLTEDKIFMNLRITQDENASGIPVFKSNMFFLKVNESINSTEEIPEEYPEWIDIANVKMQEVNNLDIDIDEDCNVTITKKDGSQKIQNVKGEQGPKGDPGAIKIQILNELPETGQDDTLYFIPKENPTENDRYDTYTWTNNDWEYMGGASIQVDLEEFVKNTDYATNENAGVIKIAANGIYGLEMRDNGTLQIAYANNDMIDKKTSVRNPITPKYVDYAVKVGITTNTEVLTEEEKTSAKTWLGINDIKTIQPDEGGNYSCHIAELEDGLYVLPQKTRVQYHPNGTTTSFGTTVLLYVTTRVSDNVKVFEVHGKEYGHYCYGYEGAVYGTLATKLMNYIPQTQQVNTFTQQQKITAEQNDYTESSTNIATMAWVQGAINNKVHIPTTDGEYKLVVSNGVASWQEIG